MSEANTSDTETVAISAKSYDLEVIDDGAIKILGGDPDFSPDVGQDAPNFHADGEVLIGFTKVGNKLRFSISNVDMDKRQNPPRQYQKKFHQKDKNNKYAIQIDKQAAGSNAQTFRLRVSLSDDLDWQFHFETTKEGKILAPMRFHTKDHKDFYNVLPDSPDSFILEAIQSGYDETDPEAQRVHSFNLYVLIEQVVGHALPVRFDPDVDNPPRLGE